MPDKQNHVRAPAEPPARRNGFWLLVLLVTLGLAACSEDEILRASDYDQTCTVVEDCVAIVVGNLCTCECQMAAINVADLERWASDAASVDCGDEGTLGTVGCGRCPNVAVACVESLCQVVY